MKKLSFLSIVMFLTISLFTSCSDENQTGTSGSEQIANEQNATEETKIPLTNLEEGALINGATKITGKPPVPTGNLDFQVALNEQTGFQKAGFNITFSSNSTIAGAYIRFKDVDGNPTNTFFDVPASSFGNRSAARSHFTNTKKIIQTISRNSEESIDVNFSNSVPAGEFCYDICIYDAANNVSAVETVCVTIEAWGGKSELVGEWILERIEEDFNDVEEIQCDNGDVIFPNFENIIDREIIVSFNEDGSYEDSIKEEISYLNYEETQNNCNAIYDDIEIREEIREGNWAFNEEESELTIVIFKLTDLLVSANSEVFEFGNYFFANILLKEATSDTLVFEETYYGYKVTYYFKSK